MNLTRRFLAAAAIVAALASAPSQVAAQAGTLPQGVAAVTLAWQYIDNTGHRVSDGTFIEVGQSISTGFLFEMDYGVTDRLSGTVGIPYIFAKYTGGVPPPFIPYLPVDTCQCWHSSFQDISLTARYRLGDDPWAVTPFVRYVQPSHDYDYRGEAVVGRNLRELQVGVNASARLVNLLPKAGVQGGYTYSSVQKILDVPNDRSNVFVSIGYAATSRLFLHADANWQRTHGGLRFGSPSGDPCVSPCDVNTPELLHEHDRMLRDNYWHVGGGLSYSFGPFDVFASTSKYVSGTDTHNGQAYTAGMTWYFDLSK